MRVPAVVFALVGACHSYSDAPVEPASDAGLDAPSTNDAAAEAGSTNALVDDHFDGADGDPCGWTAGGATAVISGGACRVCGNSAAIEGSMSKRVDTAVPGAYTLLFKVSLPQGSTATGWAVDLESDLPDGGLQYSSNAGTPQATPSLAQAGPVTAAGQTFVAVQILVQGPVGSCIDIDDAKVVRQ